MDKNRKLTEARAQNRFHLHEDRKQAAVLNFTEYGVIVVENSEMKCSGRTPAQLDLHYFVAISIVDKDFAFFNATGK